ncbi:dehydrogenase/reductase SDR family protein 7-like isoform X2 [Dermatophagoides pteronyssinus]|uniref:dehydrogenase/reductase SDR family protein 7-like isoform X2 n=1 Tax=Dermatophagoides pteronyssinus TaxID=6956 RepID=UPI003F6645FE
MKKAKWYNCHQRIFRKMNLFTLFVTILSLLLIIIYRSLRNRSRIKCFTNKAMKQLNGKNVCITGASSGLGKEIARIFYQHGCNIILASRRTDELERVKEEFLAIGNGFPNEPNIIRLDLGSVEQSENVARKISEKYKLDILINNAGISSRAQALDTVNDVDEKLLTVNFLGHIAFTKIILKSMINNNMNGKILAISSIQDRLPVPFRSSYSSSKHALRAWYDSIRSELSLIAPKILISLLSPGYIQTNISLNAMNSDGSKYGRMDSTTESGYKPEYVAAIGVEMLLNNDQECLLAPILHRSIVIIRILCPNLYFFIMKMYARKK